MKVLVTGYTGQLGFDVIRELKARNIECIGTTRNEFSLTDTEKMQAFVKAYKPDAVIHCAAYMNLTYSPCLKAGDSWIQTILAY